MGPASISRFEAAAGDWHRLLIVVLLTFVWAITVASVFEPAYHNRHGQNERFYAAKFGGENDSADLPDGYVLVAKTLFGWIAWLDHRPVTNPTTEGAFEPASTLVALRLTSLASMALLAWVVYRLRGFYGAAFVLSSPLLVWGAARAQTDLLAAATLLGAAYLLSLPGDDTRQLLGGLVAGLAPFVKQPMVLAAPFLVVRRRALLGFGIGLVPFVAYFLKAGIFEVSGHLQHGEPFENLDEVALFFVIGGLGLLFASRGWSRYLGASVAFALFAFYKSPFFHGYYLIPAVPFAALAVEPGLDARVWRTFVYTGVIATFWFLMRYH